MESWYLMGSSPVFNSGFEQEEFDDYATKGFSELLDSPISCVVQVYDKILKTWSDMKAIVQNNATDSDKQSDIRQILSVIGTLKIGMYIKYKDNIWLAISFPDDNKIYDKAIMKQCNYTLPFQIGTSTIIQEPCIVLSQSDSLSGEDEGNIITIPDSQRVVYLQYNTNTSKLTEGKRLFIDQFTDKPKVYHISKIDRICYMDGSNGLWKLTCEEDAEINESDRPDLLIADYISTNPSPTPSPSTDGYCLITNTKDMVYDNIVELKIGGTPKPFVSKFVDTNNSIITTLNPTWSIISLNGIDTSNIHITYDSSYPTRMYMQIDNIQSLIDSTFKLHLIDSANTLTGYDVDIKVVSLT